MEKKSADKINNFDYIVNKSLNQIPIYRVQGINLTVFLDRLNIEKENSISISCIC